MSSRKVRIFRAAELVDPAGRLGMVERRHRGIGDVADIDRLKPRLPAADQRQRRQVARQRGKAVEEVILGPEDQRRAQDGGAGEEVAHRRLALGLGAGIGGGRGGIGADGGNVDEAPRARRAGKARQQCRAAMMDEVEALRALLVKDAGGEDHGIGAGDGRGEQSLVAEAGVDRRDLADIAHRPQISRAAGMAADRGHDRAPPGETLDDVAADEAGAADDGDTPGAHEGVHTAWGSSCQLSAISCQLSAISRAPSGTEPG